jgi:hypothetical protein
MTAMLNVEDLHTKIIYWRNRSLANTFDPQTCACYVDAYQSVLISHGLPLLPADAVEPILSNLVVTTEQLTTLHPCTKCDNVEVSFCHISVRPYCTACHHWGELNLIGDAQHSIDVWNSKYEALHASS